jgi:hypothetical protein
VAASELLIAYDDAVLIAIEPIAASKGHSTKLDGYINFADGVLTALARVGTERLDPKVKLG